VAVPRAAMVIGIIDDLFYRCK